MNISAADLQVVVTAGAAGIGLAIATTFADAGARVFVCDIDRDALSALHSARSDIGVAYADVSNPDDVEAMFGEALVFLGGMNVLVNNAGIAGPTAPIEDISIDEWNRTVAIDLNGMFYCTRLAVPFLKTAGGGSIINLSSIGGRLGYPLRTPYAAAKWGVVGLTKSLAIELGPFNVRVNAIQPGVVEGQRIDQVVAARAAVRGIDVDEAMKRFLAPISLGRMVSAQDIANMALFLASPAGASISGQALSVCGDHGYMA